MSNTEPPIPHASLTCRPGLSPDGSPVPIRWVEDLFARLTAIVGARMGNVYAGADPALVKQEWAAALADFNADELRRGLAAVRTRKFPPNLPEFLHLCRPALDPEFAWDEARAGLDEHAAGRRFAWSHPAVYWAAHEMQHELFNAPFEHCRKRWQWTLEAQWAAREWPTPPDPTSRRLEAPERSPEPCPPAVRARFEALKQAITLRM